MIGNVSIINGQNWLQGQIQQNTTGTIGTYANGDGKDASHSGGQIGFEPSSKNKGRKEESRLKKKK